MSFYLQRALGVVRSSSGRSLLRRSPILDAFSTMRAFAAATQSEAPLFEKILVANRGEIACRVMRTAREMGIRTVAVYSEADANAKHVREADEAVCIGPAPSNASYLVIDNIVKAVRETGAQAVHPGYGFLSENSHFVERLEAEGVAFVGPPSPAMKAMGDKIESKKLALKAGVNIIPGFIGEVKTDEEILRIANEIGYPVMLKASAGGGGKGMRVAWNDKEALRGFRLSQQEAASSFGDDRMLIERFIDNPRHIEIQVIADKHGNVLYLPERECSIQRRNQKVLEEAPSTFIDKETRRAMGEQAVALARAVDYHSAGTVEMLVDSQRNFYFLEMNTRLQVEHPITELITGQDLVRHMIEVAANRPLSITQADVATPRGWATESRVYAEDPLRNFLPSIGRLNTYREPMGKGVRVDSGITEGSEISMYYDPLISKLVTYGEDRQQSIAAMRKALDTYVIRGVQHNIPFLRSMMDHPRYISGDITTKFIEEEFPEGFQGHRLSAAYRRQLTVAAAVMHYQRRARDADLTEQSESYHFPEEETYYVTVPTSAGKAATEQTPPEVVRCRVQDYGYGNVMVELCDEATGTVEQLPVSSEWTPGQPLFEATMGDADELADVDDDDEINRRHELMRALEEGDDRDGVSLEALTERLRQEEADEELADELHVQLIESQSNGYRLQICGNVYQVDVRTERQQQLAAHMREKAPLDTSAMILSPMPGALISLNVTEGESVAEGQEVAVIEAMKMQNVLRAQRSGVIKKVHCEPGSQLQVDQVIIEFEA